jgi:hypothetical protein
MITPKKAIISIVGVHAGCSPEDIFKGKAEDTGRLGYCFWALRSNKCRPNIIHTLGDEPIMCVFVSAAGASKKNKFGNSKPAMTRDIAYQYSTDKNIWLDMPGGMSEVTGKLSDGWGYAFVLENLKMVDEQFNLGRYVEHPSAQKIRMCPWCSSVCATLSSQTESDSIRKVFATADLAREKCVWLR